MGNAFVSLFAVLCFFVGYVYLFDRERAAKWDNSRRRVLKQDNLTRNAAWEAKATRRGIYAIVTGVLLLGIVSGVL